MSAKFIDQIDTSNRCVIRKRLPADAISPRIVRRSGSPAATSEPNARSRIASVTGHEMISDFSIAFLFASLKSDHIPGAPVSETVVEPLERSASLPLRSSAARTISVGPAAAPPLRITVWPSCDTCGGATDETRGVGLEDLLRPGDGRIEVARAVDDGHERVPALTGERAVDRVPRGDGLRSGGLPARARQRVLGPRRENAQAERHDGPGDRDEPRVRGRPAPKPPDGADRGHRGTSPEKHDVRRSTTDAGHAPTTANSHWFAATNAAEQEEPRAHRDGEDDRDERHRAGEREEDLCEGEARADHRTDPPTSSARSAN